MPKLNTLEVLLEQEIKDLYNAETQLLKALPKMAKNATDRELRDGFSKHLEQTKHHVERLEDVASQLHFTPRGRTCQAMKGLVEEGSETMEEDGNGTIKDLALIIAAQKVEHYEIAGYGSVRYLASQLGYEDIVKVFDATLHEEGDTDKALTSIAERLTTTLAA